MRFKKIFSISVQEQTNLLLSVLVFLLCVSISTRAMILSPVMEVLRYTFMISCALFSMVVCKYISGMTVSLFLCAAISGILNFLFIGNSGYTNFLYTLLSVFIALLLGNPRVSPQCLLYAMYFHAVMVMYCFARYGLYANIYVNSSNNYVSCFLLLPTTVYYALLSCRGERIPKLPAFVVFILSVLAMGRGGVLSAGILLTGVLFHSVKNFRPISRIFLSALVVVCAIAMIYLSSSWEIASRFKQDGMSDNGRFAIWTQYLHASFTNNLYFWLGARLKGLPIVVHYEYNLHNSFLNVHAFNGAMMFIFLFCLFLNTICYAIRHKRFMVLFCIASLFFRGMTDRLLWGAGTVGAPFMLFFLMIPQFDSLYQTKWRCWSSKQGFIRTIYKIRAKLERVKEQRYEI